MVFITLKRIIKAGYISFKRNGWLSTATITVMTMALFVLGLLVFLSALATTAFESLESKVDISVYFVADTPEENILAVKKELEEFAIPFVEDFEFLRILFVRIALWHPSLLLFIS